MKSTAHRFVVVGVLMIGAALAASWGASQETETVFDGAALLVIDIQVFYFPDGMVPLVEPEAAAWKARKLIDAFRKAGRPVIHVQHLPKGIDAPDPTGIEVQYRIHPEVLPKEGETVMASITPTLSATRRC